MPVLEELAECYEIRERRFVEPPPLAHDLAAENPDMRDRSTEARAA